jgi:non-specific serine/threonine protein kinase
MASWEQVKQVYGAVLAKDVTERAAFLDEVCAGNDDLRREVQSLLAHEEDAARFMNEPALEVAAKTFTNDPATTLAGRRLSHYHVLSLLGAGGMGEVYLAEDTRLDRQVALKILPADVAADPDRMQRFAREAKASSALNHPNVATIYDVGESDGVRFIAMEYVEGQTLAQVIGGQSMQPAAVVDIATQVADALETAHAKGIIHRDIKPANLIITPRGQVKVLDFGIAKTTRSEGRIGSSGTTTAGQTAPGLVIGSMPYVSPEQVLGRDSDARSDIFSLGVALYEMLAGRLPFEGQTTMEVLDQILHAQPRRLIQFNDSVPSELERMIHKCLEKDVERRYQSARDLLVDLRNLKRDMDAEATKAAIGQARRHNLPVQLTSFVGRRHEIAEIRRLLSSTRLLTLTGAGGCGKTRLALQVAAELLDQFEDGLWVVDLASLSEPDLITQTVAATLGVREGPNRTLTEALTEYFRHRHVLLVLDNCEHLIAACAQLVEPLLLAGSNLQVLATSREGLGIPGETVWRVPSLLLPDPSEPVVPDTLLQYEAVSLFAERAATVDGAFTITAGNAATVADVCRRLDGIPLAIELAAARLKVLSVEQIHTRLKDRFRLLTGGSRTAVARQRTLEATIDWSYDLLSETERLLLCRLSVFPGNFTLEAAEEICAGNGIDKDAMLDLLTRLVDKSLVNVDERSECKRDSAQPSGDAINGSRRFRCLETVRQYARERLLRSGDMERVRDLHLDFFFALVQRAEPELIRRDQVSWLKRLQLDYPNLRSALEWCLEAPGYGEKGLDFAAALFWFWIKRAYFDEGRQWLQRALAAGRTASSGLRAKALNGVGITAILQADYAGALPPLRESLALSREAGDHGAIALSLGAQALVAMDTGNIVEAARLATEGRAAAVESGELWRQAPSLSVLAHEAQHEGDYDRACRLTEEALDLFRRNGDKWGTEQHLWDLAFFQVLQGRYAQAEATCAEALVLSQEREDQMMTAYHLANLAAAQAGQGHAVRAVRLWGATKQLLESVGSIMQNMAENSLGDRYLAPLKQSLGEDGFHSALSEGGAMSFTQAIQYALHGSEDELPS